MQETSVRFLGQEDPLEKDRLPTPVFLGFPGGSAGKESACKAGDLGWEDSLEKGTAIHSRVLTYIIDYIYSPWGGKQLDTTEQLSLSYCPCLDDFNSS